MASFVHMTASVKHVLVPLEGGRAFDIIEKWPIVQASALEEIGGGGFFTLVHQVDDASPMLEEMFRRVDGPQLETMFFKFLVPMHRHWAAVASNISKAETRATGMNFEAAAEPLRSYVGHSGQILGYDNGGRSGAPGAVAAGAAGIAVGLTMKQFTNGAGVVTHVCVECGAPDGPVRCGRTLLLLESLAPAAEGSSQYVLAQTYALLGELADGAIAEYCDPDAVGFLDAAAVEASAVDRFMHAVVARGLYPAGYAAISPGCF
jgi:hypothetical protein